MGCILDRGLEQGRLDLIVAQRLSVRGRTKKTPWQGLKRQIAIPDYLSEQSEFDLHVTVRRVPRLLCVTIEMAVESELTHNGNT